LVKASQKGATTVCGGGDTISLVNMVPGASKTISHLSTGGGASLELVEGKILPGIEYLSEESDLKNYH
jgi:phosphoglycerate kinase